MRPPSQRSLDARAREATPLFGRERDAADVEAMLASGARLVTIHGPAGIGKTRLALRVLERSKVATCFCDLTEARDEPAVELALAHSLGARRDATDRARAIAEAASRAPLVLVLDNCEQAIDAAANMAATLLGEARALAMIATSRELLRVPGEAAYAIDPLTLPSREEAVESADSVRLFVDRARRVRPSYALGDDAADVAAIVRRLEGMPLAIELAAARLSALDAKTLRARLDEGFGVLSTGARTASPRQRTLRGAIEWSWDLLSEDERAAFAQASAFRGGFDLHDAEAVVRAGAPAMDLVQALVEKSLVRAVVSDDGALRFSMVESIRAFAASKLEELGHAREVEARHRKHFIARGTAWEASSWHGAVATVKRLALDLENLRVARASAVRDEALDPDAALDALGASIALHPIFALRGPFRSNPLLEDRAADDARLARAPHALRARFFLVRGRALQLVGMHAESNVEFGRALKEARAAGDDRLEARALVHLGTADRADERHADARDRFEQALAKFERARDDAAASVVLSALAALDLVAGDLARAGAALERAVAMQRKLGDAATAAMMLVDLALVSAERGDLGAAIAAFDEAIATHRAHDNRRWLAVSLGYRACALLERGDRDEARRGLEEALDILEAVGDPKFEAVFGATRAAVLAMQGDVDEALAAFDAVLARAEGRVEPRIHAALVVHRAHGDVARGDLDAARERRAAAVGFARQSDDVRFALRVLDRALGSIAAHASAPTRAPSLVVERDGSSFTPPEGARVDLAKRRTAQRVLTELVRRRIEAPGEAVSATRLVAAGWPGERLAASVAKNRLHVALNQLRELGLRGVVLAREGGYLLDPAVPVVLER